MTTMMSSAIPFTSAPMISHPAMLVTAASEPPPPRRASLPQPHKDDQNRRSACDRCRRQKLRCERRTTATLQEACKRCLKSRSKCVTGPSLPMGRPRIRTRSTSPFDYRSGKRDSLRETASATAEYAPMAAPPLPTSSSSPSRPATTSSMADIPVSNVGSMMPPTTVSMLEMGPPAKLMHEAMYTEVPDLYSTGHPVIGQHHSTRHEDHVRSLYDLCAQILGQCHAVSARRSGNPWSMGSHSIDSIVAGMTNPVEQGFGSGLSVGELLELSNEFLRLSQSLLFPSAHKSPLSSRQSSIDHSNYNYSANAFHQLRSAGVNSYSPTTSPPFDDKDTNFSPSSIPSLSSSVATSMSPGFPERLDFPTILTLYTCYSAILRIYRTLLTRVHVAILSQPMPWSSLDSIVPGIYPDGVQTEQRPDLQVKVFAQVCRDLLDQMEKSVTVSTKFYHGGAEPELLRALVETVVKAEASEGAARIVSPKALIDEIIRTVDSGLGV